MSEVSGTANPTEFTTRHRAARTGGEIRLANPNLRFETGGRFASILSMQVPQVVVVMGAAGCGKSTVGALLASKYSGSFHDADDFHPPANIAKMAAGLPLNDRDRAPWLERLRQEVIDAAPAGGLLVLACSALKKVYREQLGVGTSGVALVYLKGDAATLTIRLAARPGHYMKAGMLDSQLAILEEPLATEGFTVGIASSAGEIVAAIGAALNLPVSP